MENISTISDVDLIETICQNTKKMQEIINSDPMNIENNTKVLKTLDELFMMNVECYNEAHKRKLGMPNSNFMKVMCTLLGYQWEDLFRVKKRNKLTKKR